MIEVKVLKHTKNAIPDSALVIALEVKCSNLLNSTIVSGKRGGKD